MSSGCHRNRPKKEKQRAGYLGTPYEFVTFSFLLASVIVFRRPRTLVPKRLDLRCGEQVAEFNLVFFFLI